MTTNKEKMKAIAEDASCIFVCPLIDDIARQAAIGFELASECSFENEEDEIIFDLAMRLYSKKLYMEAVDLISITFSLIGDKEMALMTALIAESGREEVYETFMDCFVTHSERCELRHISVNLS